jgi:hypothetical protein
LKFAFLKCWNKKNFTGLPPRARQGEFKPARVSHAKMGGKKRDILPHHSGGDFPPRFCSKVEKATTKRFDDSSTIASVGKATQ